MFILTAKFLFVFQTLGSIPWQSYFQRVLSVRSVGDARRLSFLAGLSSLVCAVPPICLGVVGATVGNEGRRGRWDGVEVKFCFLLRRPTLTVHERVRHVIDY